MECYTYAQLNMQMFARCNRMDEFHDHNIQEKKQDTKENIYDYIYINFKNG